MMRIELGLDDLRYNTSMDIRQTEIAAAVTIGKPSMVDAHQMQNRCVQVMHMNRAFGRIHHPKCGCDEKFPTVGYH